MNKNQKLVKLFDDYFVDNDGNVKRNRMKNG